MKDEPPESAAATTRGQHVLSYDRMTVFGYCFECRVRCTCGASGIGWGDIESEALADAICDASKKWKTCRRLRTLCVLS